MADNDVLMEDSLDGGPPSVGSGEIPHVTSTPGSTSATASTPATTKRKNKNKVVTGYILYSREVRKQIVQNNPESNFGEISRIVGNEWRSLPATEKQSWEERATKLNEETKALLLAEEANCPSPLPGEQIYECLWDSCDFQFEELSDVIEHCVKDKESQGHVQGYFQANPDSEFHCRWRNCLRNNKKQVQPFPNIARLVRHVRDMHINKQNPKIVPASERSKNFKVSTKSSAASRQTSSTALNTPAGGSFNSTAGSHSSTPATSTAASPPLLKQEPIFISVPPRPQRVFHSEAYIKYIEGLQSENKYITAWDKTLLATQDNISTAESEKLSSVTTWLGKKADQRDNVLAALWALRNQLLKDALGIPKTL